MATPKVCNSRVFQSTQTKSPDSRYLSFTDEEIQKGWDLLNPYIEGGYRPTLKEDPYRKETYDVLVKRNENGYTNFPNIGGNSSTRVTEDDETFVEANWITPQLIATGYPTIGKMRDNYWNMIGSLQKTHTVFIVNFMSDSDASRYGGWFFNEQAMGEKKYLVSVLDHKNQPIYFYHYPYWVDHGEGDAEIVGRFIKELHTATQAVKMPVVVVNCRAGVGRTGTFANLLELYKKMKETKELRKEDFSMNTIVEQVIVFRRERGDQQFVQSYAQFKMLCRMVEYFFNEEIDNRPTKG